MTGSHFGGVEDGRKYCTDAYTEKKEDDFTEANANFEMMLYVDIAAASASAFRTPIP